ncbi:MAG: small subunit ribosomal protein S6 [Phycisphaerales bacterium]|jgi:small subunit ribosomal protein S6
MTTQTTARVGSFEVMILVSQAAAAQFGSLLEHLDEIFARAGAELVAMKKWDDRRLAFEIDKQKRGVYLLAYITCPVDQVSHIERDVQISERVLRVLITKADHLSAEEIASNDERQALADEAKMRGAEMATEAAEQSSKVRLGAPVAEEQAAAPGEAPAEGAAADAAPAADAPAEAAAPAADAPAEAAAPAAAAPAEAAADKPADEKSKG